MLQILNCLLFHEAAITKSGFLSVLVAEDSKYKEAENDDDGNYFDNSVFKGTNTHSDFLKGSSCTMLSSCLTTRSFSVPINPG